MADEFTSHDALLDHKGWEQFRVSKIAINADKLLVDCYERYKHLDVDAFFSEETEEPIDHVRFVLHLFQIFELALGTIAEKEYLDLPAHLKWACDVSFKQAGTPIGCFRIFGGKHVSAQEVLDDKERFPNGLLDKDDYRGY